MRLIDADAFEVFSYSKDEMWSDSFDDGVQMVLEKIDQAPTIDAVPVKHGEWKFCGDTGTTHCTACGWNIEECFYDPNTNEPYYYCPNCGAKMDGKEKMNG